MGSGATDPPNGFTDQNSPSGIEGGPQTLATAESISEARSPDDLFVVIPAYNEAVTIRDVLERTLRYAKNVVLVDDGSQDGTGDLVRDLPILVLRQDQNGGKASALVVGFGHALEHGAKGVITLDADGQHSPEEIPLFIDAYRSHPTHIIVGSRLWNRAAIPTVRYWANRLASFWVSWASGARLEDCQSGFRLYPASVLKAVQARHGAGSGFTFESEILINAARAGHGISFVRISVSYPPNHMQQTHYDHVRDNARMVRMIASKLVSRRWKQ